MLDLRRLLVLGLIVGGLITAGCRDRAAAREPPPPRSKPTEPVLKRVAAIGDLSELSPAERRALDPADHRPRLPAGPNDWLSQHPEPGQTFAQYERSSPNRPDERRRVIYLLPLGELSAERAPPLEDLAALVAAFFQLEVRVLPMVELAVAAATRRINDDTGQPQVLAPDLLRWLTLQVPRDAYALMAVTMTDLYPEPSWNFVYGQATFTERVGVQSFARYDPAFFDEPRPADWRQTLTRRSAQVLVHELAHMFGLPHCVHWSCVVAGANHQAEFDAHPMHPCPVCLRKLWWNIGFDLAAREAALAVAWRRLGLEDEAAWSEARARAIADAR